MNDDGPRHEDEGRSDPSRQAGADAATVADPPDSITAADLDHAMREWRAGR
jgi:hypothetical protein